MELRFTPVVLDGKSNPRQQSKISCATLERTQVTAKFITENVDLVNSINVVKDSLLIGSAVSNLCGSPRVKTGPTDYWIARLAFGRAVECRAKYVKRCQRSRRALVSNNLIYAALDSDGVASGCRRPFIKSAG